MNIDDTKTIEDNVILEPKTEPELEEKTETEENAEAELNTEDNLEIRKMKFKDRTKAKLARLKKNMEGMSKKEKAKYIIYYYKWHFIIGALLLFLLISVPLTIYKNTRPVAISYVVINSPNYLQINTDAFLDYKEYYDFDKSDRILGITSINISLETYDENYNADDPSYSTFPMNCYDNFYDVIFTDRAGLEYCSSTNLIYPIEDILTKDVEDIIFEEYPDLVVTAKNYADIDVPYAIDISDTDFAKSLNLGYEEIFICFPGSEERNIVNTKKMINYIFNFNLEI